MLAQAKPGALVAAFAVSLLAAQPAALASHRGCKKPDVDVESLKATLWHDYDSWKVSIKYEVEVEDARPDRFDVVITFSQHDRLLRNRQGQVIQLLDVLDRPSDVDDDEFEFKKRLSASLPRGVLQCPKKLKVRLEVFDRRTGRVVDSKKESVKRNKRVETRARDRLRHGDATLSNYDRRLWREEPREQTTFGRDRGLHGRNGQRLRRGWNN